MANDHKTIKNCKQDLTEFELFGNLSFGNLFVLNLSIYSSVVLWSSTCACKLSLYAQSVQVWMAYVVCIDERVIMIELD